MLPLQMATYIRIGIKTKRAEGFVKQPSALYLEVKLLFS